jgi:membrane fusion protein (multidrug efflux system)
MMNRSSALAAALLSGGLLIAAGGLALYKVREISAASQSGPGFEPAEAVDIVEVGRAPWQPTSDLVGSVIATRSVMVSNERAGVVTTVGFESGTIVEKGQLVLAQDDAADRADLEAAKASVRVAEASVAEAESRIELAERTLDRINTVGVRAIAATERDRAEAEVRSARAERTRWLAEVDQALAHIAQVEARLAKLTIVAPFRARAGLRLVHEGQYLAEGASIVTLQEVTDEIYLDFAIPQEYAPRVTPGAAVMATGDLLGPDPVRIEVAAVDATVNSDTRNLRVRAVVDNRRGVLLPGMFIQIRVPVETPKEYVMAPGTAVRRSSYADSVFVVAPDEEGALRVRQRFVKLGPAVGEQMIVLEGLEPGERIAATGSFKLRDGALVRPAGPEPAAGAAPLAGADPADPM